MKSFLKKIQAYYIKASTNENYARKMLEEFIKKFREIHHFSDLSNIKTIPSNTLKQGFQGLRQDVQCSIEHDLYATESEYEDIRSDLKHARQSVRDSMKYDTSKFGLSWDQDTIGEKGWVILKVFYAEDSK